MGDAVRGSVSDVRQVLILMLLAELERRQQLLADLGMTVSIHRFQPPATARFMKHLNWGPLPLSGHRRSLLPCGGTPRQIDSPATLALCPLF